MGFDADNFEKVQKYANFIWFSSKKSIQNLLKIKLYFYSLLVNYFYQQSYEISKLLYFSNLSVSYPMQIGPLLRKQIKEINILIVGGIPGISNFKSQASLP